MNMSEITQEVLYEELLKNKGKNTAISPVSLDIVLYMLALGCSAKAGSISLFSKLDGISSDLSTLMNIDDVAMYNYLLIRDDMPVTENYVKSLHTLCKGNIKQFDPSQPGIQEFVEAALAKETEGLIIKVPKLVTTDAAIVNGTRFKGKWKVEFGKEDQYVGEFYASDAVIEASFLRGRGAAYIKNETMEGVELRYANQDFVLFMLLPNTKNLSLSQCLESLDHVVFASLYECTSEFIDYCFPEFEIDYTFSAIPALEKAASMGVNCTFDGIVKDQNLFVSDIIQGAKITVDREGAVAEAVTFATMVNYCSLECPKFINFDRPFLYGIKHIPTDNILFLGTCYSPEKK